MSRHVVDFVLNGEAVRAEVDAGWVLADVLRDVLGRTGTKIGCGVGVCGVCSVLVDSRLTSACLLPAVQLSGRSVCTIEGEAQGSELTPLQQAFIDQGGFQCGICTPGQIMAARALLEQHPCPSEAEIADWMTGNLCRCTGYYGITRAIRQAAGSAS